MITGYNTDVPHSDVVFHVQTEDKGLPAAWIESLIYVGGRIVARKRSSYKSELDQGGDKKVISDLMDRQHRLMISQIRRGKFDAKVAAVTASALEKLSREDREPAVVAAEESSAEVPVPPPETAEPGTAPVEPEIPEIPEIPETAQPAPTLDQVILDYLSTEAEQEHLVLVLDTEDELAFGRKAAITLHTKSSVSGQPLAETAIAVKMISTVAEPETLAGGKTDDEGRLVLSVEIPSLRRGMGALIITAQSDLGTAEIKQLL